MATVTAVRAKSRRECRTRRARETTNGNVRHRKPAPEHRQRISLRELSALQNINTYVTFYYKNLLFMTGK